MSVEMWRKMGNTVIRVVPLTIALEDDLESAIDLDPSMLGRLLIIGRQVRTGFGGRIDLLAIDEIGLLYVIEVKRGETPSDVVTQLFSYSFWAQKLARADLIRIYAKRSGGAVTLEASIL